MDRIFWLLTVLMILMALAAEAQQTKTTFQRVGNNVRQAYIEVQPGQSISFIEKEPVTSISIKYTGIINGAKVINDSREYGLFRDEHYQGNQQASNLVVFDKPVREFILHTGELSGEINIILINTGKIRNESRNRSNQEGGECQKPALIEQATWREGLPEPQYNRSFTVTENIIVHHSATSNQVTDYTNVVRNIYVYHTQANGWSDIGYNYLIAPNGIIYKGRDPALGEQDLVIGAHFCGSNSTTMGVCLLGTFTHVPPTDQTLEVLTNLLAWKAEKDGLNPLGVDPHPLNATLPIIAGHRDGCSTECPGEEAYELLPAVRVETENTIEQCDEEELLVLYPNPAEFYFNVELWKSTTHEFKLYDVRGQLLQIFPSDVTNNIANFSISNFTSGLYILHYQTESQLLKAKLVISK